MTNAIILLSVIGSLIRGGVALMSQPKETVQHTTCVIMENTGNTGQNFQHSCCEEIGFDSDVCL